MAYPADHRVALLSLFLVACVGVVPIFWSSRETSYAQPSCPPCDCNCNADNIFAVPLGILNSSYSDCGQNDSDLNEEMEKDAVRLLSEELNLQKNVADDSLERTKGLITEAKKSSSHYLKEAEKCNTGMETCEAARENAEAALIEEHKLSALWEERARELGWKDERRIYS